MGTHVMFMSMFMFVFTLLGMWVFIGAEVEGGCKGANISGYCLWILANVFLPCSPNLYGGHWDVWCGQRNIHPIRVPLNSPASSQGSLT